MIDLFEIGFVSISIIDIIDIVVVGLLFYWVYSALKGTVAVQVLIIMIFLILLSFVTEAINLKAVSWIIKTITNVWLIAYIILFQPEIRRLLMILTRSRIFNLFVKSKISEIIGEVLAAVSELTEKHIGAIIVFQRSQSADMTIDPGIELQSIVSKELIISIFNTKSPLHDGAIIISKDLITRAKAILPLSTHTSIDGRILGTRHRAGLGLSEQVDALVLIVSEETGLVSIAEEGRITLNIPKSELNEILNDKLSGN